VLRTDLSRCHHFARFTRRDIGAIRPFDPVPSRIVIQALRQRVHSESLLDATVGIEKFVGQPADIAFTVHTCQRAVAFDQ